VSAPRKLLPASKLLDVSEAILYLRAMLIIRALKPLFLSVLIAASTSLTACSKAEHTSAPEKPSAPEWNKYVPENADLLAMADLNQLRSSDWYADTPEDPRNLLLKEKAHFSFDDISSFVLCSDLDAMPSLESLKDIVNIDSSGMPESSSLKEADLEGFNARVILPLKKTITWSEAAAAVEIIFSSVTNASVEQAADQDVIVVTQTSSPMPLRIALSDRGDALIMDTGKAEVTSKPIAPSAGLLQRELAAAANGPVRIVIEPSDAMRTKLQQAASDPKALQGDTTTVIIGSALKSLSSFCGMGIALTPGKDTTGLYAEIELGSTSEALEAEAAVKNILVPLITLTLTQYSQQSGAQPILQSTSTDVKGSKVVLRATLRVQQSPDGTASNR